MIHYITPYAIDKNYFAAIDAQMRGIPENDWVCIRDGDTMFLYPDFGHKLQGYIDRYPDTGLFSCMTNRCHYSFQTFAAAFDEKDIVYHHHLADLMFKCSGYSIKEVNRRIAGHLMLIRKSTWSMLRLYIQRKCVEQQKHILGVDTKISNAVLKCGMKIRIMEGFYLFHFLRMDKDIGDKSHLE